MINVKYSLKEGKLAPEVTPKLRLKLALRAARDAARKTAQEAADAVGKSRQAISAWERLDESAPLPDGDDFEKLAALYGLTPRELHNLYMLPAREGREDAYDARVSEKAPNWPRRSSGSPLPAVREYLAELRLRLTKASVPDEEIEEAMDLLRAPQLFRYFKDGEMIDYSESDALDGVKSIANDVIIPRLRKLGRKIP
jgi:transcriptional regulator with XRE-family HTH domain